MSRSSFRRQRDARSAVRCSAVLVCLAAALLGDPRIAGAAQAEAEPAAVKAAFLYRFRGYVQWPDSRPGQFTVAVLGDDALAGHLRRFLQDRPAELASVRVVAVRSAEQAFDSNVLFVGRAELARLRAHVAAIGTRPVLVVSDEADTLRAGQTINFVTIDRRIRFEVSLGAAERAGLRINAGLLNVASRVEGARPGSGLECVGGLCAPRPLLARHRGRARDDRA